MNKNNTLNIQIWIGLKIDILLVWQIVNLTNLTCNISEFKGTCFISFYMANDITENEYLLFAFFKTTDNLINSLVSFGQEA